MRVYSGSASNSPITVLLDLGARYLLGAEAEYVQRKDIEDGVVTYDIVTTETDLLMIQIGVTANF